MTITLTREEVEALIEYHITELVPLREDKKFKIVDIGYYTIPDEVQLIEVERNKDAEA